MVSVNIAIKKEAYDFLKELKTEDKSFSDVILSFKKKQKNIMRFWGIITKSSIDKKEMQDFRDSFNKRLA
ncbi:hypothetical protein HYY69_04335 [Candidatus Woesearchaeota archaeon]|nr:hypothetical protein [Candidatus Woesearchaeota archaeon]